MKWADVGILLMPAGRSAHMEAGYFVAAGKPLLILLADGCEPELMWKMATALFADVESMVHWLSHYHDAHSRANP